MFEDLVGQGKVLGGHLVNGTVSIGYKGDLVVAAGLSGGS